MAKHVDDVNVKGWIAALSLFGVVAWFLPVSAMAAALALGAAALWLLSQSRERPAPSSLSTGAVKVRLLITFAAHAQRTSLCARVTITV